MIYWDIDGVLRNLCEAVWGKEPDDWDYKEGDIDFYDVVNPDLKILERAKPTEYIAIPQSLKQVCILSCQPISWRDHTDNWLVKQFPQTRVHRNYVDKPAQKLNYLKAGDVLIEDYPMFNDYSNIILVNRNYNKLVKCNRRVYDASQLRELLFN